MNKIERPDWLGNAIDIMNVTKRPYHFDADYIDEWFTANLEGKWIVSPDDLVDLIGYEHGYEHDYGFNFTTSKESTGDLKAYLIKSSIEPIKQETCRDVLAALLEDASVPCDWTTRIKAALSREGE